MPEPEPLCAGIDVTRTSLELALDGKLAGSNFSNDAQGVAALRTHLAGLPVMLTALRSAGGLAKHCARALLLSGLDVVVVHPRHGYAFTQATGHPGAPDRIDAPALSRFARMLHQNARREQVPLKMTALEQQMLDALMGRRRQLIHMRNAESRRLEQMRHPTAIRSIEEVIEMFGRQIDKLDRSIDGTLKLHFERKLKSLETFRMPGPRSGDRLTPMAALN
jgi:transposase